MPSRPGEKFLGLPGWIDSNQYTIDAVSDVPQTNTMMLGPMMQAVLEDRFKLRIRRTAKVQLIYELRAKPGIALPPAKGGNCMTVDSDHPPPLPDAGQPLPNFCGGFAGRYA